MRFYHISEKYLGKKPTFSPRVPSSSSEGELEIPRICVAPTIEGCYIAVEAHRTFVGCVAFHVYAVDTEDYRWAHQSVGDRRHTGEAWLTAPHQFIHLGKLPSIKQRDVHAGLEPTQNTRTIRSRWRTHVRWLHQSILTVPQYRH